MEITQAWRDARWSGKLDGMATYVNRHGLADTRLRLSLNLIGAPALAGRDYAVCRAATDVETIVGVALGVQFPTGNYRKDKLLNIGSNRFNFRRKSVSFTVEESEPSRRPERQKLTLKINRSSMATHLSKTRTRLAALTGFLSRPEQEGVPYRKPSRPARNRYHRGSLYLFGPLKHLAVLIMRLFRTSIACWCSTGT